MTRRGVSIDGMKMNVDLFGGTVGENLDEILGHHVPADRIVSRIMVDEHLLYENGEFLAKVADLESGKQIDVVTESLEAVLRQSVMTLLTHLSQMIQLFSEIGRNLRKGAVDKVFGGEGTHKDRGGPYVQGIEAMVAAQTLVDRIRTIHRDNPSIQAEAPLELVTETNRFEEILMGMLTCQENQDWILLADMLEYELMPIFSAGLSNAEHYLQTMGGVVPSGRR